MPPILAKIGGMPASVISVFFGPGPHVSRASFDSGTGEWTFTVSREKSEHLPPSRADVPLEVRDALAQFAGELTKIAPVGA